MGLVVMQYCDGAADLPKLRSVRRAALNKRAA
jgi:hypothetical protein